jgi:tetratricopeptide (TPR) repeat protein
MKRLLLTILFSSAIFLGVFSQNEKKFIREGNKQYDEGNFAESEVQYRKALTKNPNSFKGKFNLGDAMYEQKNFAESGKLYNELTETNVGESEKSGAYYNLGNSYMSEKKYKESIEAYKNSLRLNPDDEDARYNLEYARKMLQQQQQQQQQNQDQNKEDQDKKDQNKDQQDNQQQPQQISKEDAKRMMEALKNNEKKTLQKLQEEKAKAAGSSGSDIDW